MRAALRIVLNSYNSRKPMQFLNNTGRLKENYVNQAVEHFCINGTILVARNTILTAAFEKIVKDLKYCIKNRKNYHRSTYNIMKLRILILSLSFSIRA